MGEFTSFTILITFLILFMFDRIDLNDKDEYMGDSKLPLGFMNVIFTLLIKLYNI